MCTFPPLFSLSEWVTFVGCGHFVECKLYHSGTVSQLIGRFQMTSDDDNGPKRPPKVTSTAGLGRSKQDYLWGLKLATNINKEKTGEKKFSAMGKVIYTPLYGVAIAN